MSVPPTMEDVSSCAIIPLAASTATALLATSWMGMDSIALVSFSLKQQVDGKKHTETRHCVYTSVHNIMAEKINLALQVTN